LKRTTQIDPPLCESRFIPNNQGTGYPTSINRLDVDLPRWRRRNVDQPDVARFHGDEANAFSLFMSVGVDHGHPHLSWVLVDISEDQSAGARTRCRTRRKYKARGDSTGVQGGDDNRRSGGCHL